MLHRIIRLLTVLLAALFIISAIMNLGFKIPLGFVELSFALPSSSIATFEVAIGVVLLVAAAFSNLYVYGGTYLFALVGIVEGLVSSDVQGLARSIHEVMIPFAVSGFALVLVEAQQAYKKAKSNPAPQKNREIVMALQFFVGGLVTFGGAAYAKNGTYPVGTALGLVHLAVGVSGLIGGYYFMRRMSWSTRFLIGTNSITIAYSAFSETLAQMYDYLTPGITDSLIGTIVAIVVSAVILRILTRRNGISKIQDQQASIST